MMKKVTSLLLLTFTTTLLFSQNPSSSIATWQNDAGSAYTLTHDDFGLGNANGIEDYADTMGLNRGVRISFGAIISECDNQDWLVAQRMIANGHRVMNHTWNHRCGDPSAGAWCVAYGVWDEDDYDLEMKQANEVIEANAGQRPYFFIYPFDQFVPSMNDYLRDTLDYLGARTGPYDQGPNPSNMSDPFQPAFWVTRPGYDFDFLISSLDATVAQGAWGMREFHGVQDNSWGSVTYNDYRDLLDRLKGYMDNNQVWVAPAAEVIAYINQRQAFDALTNYNQNLNEITVSWTNSNPSMKTSNLIIPITLMIDLDGATGDWSIEQNNETITSFREENGTLFVEVYPHLGEVVISDGQLTTFANFSASSTQVLTSEEVVFANESSPDASSFFWDFGADASPSTAIGAGPHTVSYSSSGSKTVSLTVNNDFEEVKENFILVSSFGITPNFTVDQQRPALGETVVFTDASVGSVSSYEWSFGDGAVPSTATGAGPHTVSYNTTGTKTVTLRLNGAETETKENYVSVVNDNSTLSCYEVFDFDNASTDFFDTYDVPNSPYNHQVTNGVWSIISSGHREWDNASFDFNDNQSNLLLDITNEGYEPTVTFRARASSDVLVRMDMVELDGNTVITSDNVSGSRNLFEVGITWETFTVDFTGDLDNIYACNGGCGPLDQTQLHGLMFFLNPGYSSFPVGGYNEEFVGTMEIDFISVGDSVSCASEQVVADFFANNNETGLNEVITFTNNSFGNVSSYVWDFGDGATPPTATGPGPHDVVYTTPGFKTVSLSVDDNRSTEVKTNYVKIEEIATGLFGKETYASVNVFPNPVVDVLQIDASNEIQKIEVFSIDGVRLVQNLEQNSIDLRTITQGNYLVQVTTREGVAIQKITKE